MAKALKHEAVLPDGSIAKRSSQSRVYSHMIAVRSSYAHALANAKGQEVGDKEEWNYSKACASVQPGEKYPREGYNFKVTEESHQKGVAMLAAHADFASFRAARIAARVAAVEARKARGDFERWGDAGWCGRLDLAQKALATAQGNPWNAEARIIEAKHP